MLLSGDGLHRMDGPLNSLGGGLLSTLNQVNPQAVDSLTRSLQQSGIDMDSAGAGMRIQTLFLRGMHEESLRRSSATGAGYGASLAANPAQSIFGVPQLSQMDGESVSVVCLDLMVLLPKRIKHHLEDSLLFDDVQGRCETIRLYTFEYESIMPENASHSRLVLRSNLPGTNEEGSEDEEP
ncbi:unnamed protein product, partial [Strongylus vulgaris]